MKAYEVILKMKKIILAGASLNSGNRGVNALTRGQINLILDKYGIDTNIIILSYGIKVEKANNISYKGENIIVKEVPTNIKKLVKAYVGNKLIGINYILKEIRSADAIWDITEGDSFSDIYGIRRFLHYSLIKLIAIKNKKKLIIMPQTLGPFERSWVKSVAKYIFNKADKVFVRDEISKKVMIEDLKLTREILYAPDLAFYMKPDDNMSINKFISDSDSVKIGINVSALLYNGGYTGNNMFNLKIDYKKLVTMLIETFAKIDNTQIILIPHVMLEELEVEDDFRVCKKIAEEMKIKANIDLVTLDKYYREDELKAIISGCDFFIGSRMHACIGAISTEVPTAPIAYSRKFIGIWDKLGLGNCVMDPKVMNEEEIIKEIVRVFKDRNEVKEVLIKEIPKLKSQIEQIVDIIEGK